jgi:hypothetical protein
LAM